MPDMRLSVIDGIAADTGLRQTFDCTMPFM